MNIDKILTKSLEYHKSGNLSRAEQGYKKVLKSESNNVNANYLLGIIVSGNGKYDYAIDLFNTALRVDPQNNEVLYDLGNAYKDKGDFDSAVNCYKKATTISPDHYMAYNNLGFILREKGELEQALECFNRALKIKPDYVLAYNNLGILFDVQDKLEESMQCYQKVLSLNPDNADAYNNIGNLLRKQNELDKAIDCFRKAIAIKHDFVAAYNNMGFALKETNNLTAAAESYQKALGLNPDYVEALNGYAVVLQEQSRLGEAKVYLLKALSILPDYVPTYINLGVVLYNLGEHEESMRIFQKALDLNPDYPEIYINLGRAYQEQGEIEKSKNCYNQALLKKHDFAEVYLFLSRLHKFVSSDDEILKAMENLYANSNNSEKNIMYLGFSLGKAYEDIGEYDKAFECLSAANRIKRKTYQYSIKDDMEKVEWTKNLFDSDYLKNNNATEITEETPIFILGMPRSGTTLVEQILSSHPSVYGAGELMHFKLSLSKLFEIQTYRQMIDFFEKNELDKFSALGSEYMRLLKLESNSSKFITDKMPQNFWFIGLIYKSLPNAKIIHCVRNPADNCFSIYKNFFAGHHPYGYDLQELGEYYLLYKELMEHWHSVLPGVIYDVTYEDLVADQEIQTRNLLEYCNLPWDDACLSFHKTKRSVKTASAVQVRQPMYKDSICLWEHYSKQLEPLSLILEK